MSGHRTDEIARYFRGDLGTAAARDALFDHLRSCESCRASFDAESAAHRALSGRSFGKAELAAMMPAVVDAARPRPTILRWAGVLAAAATAALAVVVLQPPEGGFTPKGAARGEPAVVHVICFDESLAVTARRTESGACKAPGLVKVVYAGASAVPTLTVVVMSGEEVRAHATVSSPASGDVLPDHARLGPGETLRVIAIGADGVTPLDIAKDTPPVLTVRGEP